MVCLVIMLTFQDERFDQSVDRGTAFRHATMLCMPVTHGARKPSKVLGVFQLVNKFDGLKFTRNDENFVEAFAIFCGMGINNVRMYEKTVVAMAKQQASSMKALLGCEGIASCSFSAQAAAVCLWAAWPVALCLDRI